MRWIDRWKAQVAAGLWLWFVLLVHYWHQARRIASILVGGR